MAGGEISVLLAAAVAGEREAESRLLDLVYAQLKRTAEAQMRGERAGHSLQPSALVHETYIRLLGSAPVRFENRAHFFTTAAGTMRRILIDHARGKRRAKRAGGLRVELADDLARDPQDIEGLLRMNAALDKLAEQDARQARTVELRIFGGLTLEETAAVLGVSVVTVKRDWRMARAWLKVHMADERNAV